MPKRGAVITWSLRSYSSGLPVRSACTGASKPSAAAEAGTSCTSPSVLMITPARRSGGTSDKAWPRSVNNMVPSRSLSAEVEAEWIQRTSRLGTDLSLSSRSLRICSVRAVRPAIAWLWLSSTTTASTSLRGSRSSRFRCGLASARRRSAKLNRRKTAPRRARQNKRTSKRAPMPAMVHRTGHGTKGRNSTDQFMSLPQPLEQGRDVHLIGLVVAGERVHHDVDAGAERHLALHFATRDGRIDRPVGVVERPGRGEVVRGDDDRAYSVGAARALAPLGFVIGLGLDPQRAAVIAAGEAPHQIERLGQDVVLGHRLKRGYVELTDEAGQGLVLRAAVGKGDALVAGVEDDQPALLHIGVDLGERRVGERLRVVAHRPIEDGEEGQLVLVDVHADRVGRLERGPRAKHLAQA